VKTHIISGWFITSFRVRTRRAKMAGVDNIVFGLFGVESPIDEYPNGYGYQAF
jgi:hypothetical protein